MGYRSETTVRASSGGVTISGNGIKLAGASSGIAHSTSQRHITRQKLSLYIVQTRYAATATSSSSLCSLSSTCPPAPLCSRSSLSSLSHRLATLGRGNIPIMWMMSTTQVTSTAQPKEGKAVVCGKATGKRMSRRPPIAVMAVRTTCFQPDTPYSRASRMQWQGDSITYPRNQRLVPFGEIAMSDIDQSEENHRCAKSTTPIPNLSND